LIVDISERMAWVSRGMIAEELAPVARARTKVEVFVLKKNVSFRLRSKDSSAQINAGTDDATRGVWGIALTI